jgi:thioesterase domain-containing protein
MVTGLVKSRLPGGRSPVAEVDDEDEDARWMRTLETVESHYQPKGFHGDVTVFTTAGMARATGSRTLGWDRYVAGSIEARRVGGGHNSMLKPPHVSALAGEFGRRLDAVQQELA